MNLFLEMSLVILQIKLFPIVFTVELVEIAMIKGGRFTNTNIFVAFAGSTFPYTHKLQNHPLML